MTGEQVIHNGKPIQLCGCIMQIKSVAADVVGAITNKDLQLLKCPAERW